MLLRNKNVIAILSVALFLSFALLGQLLSPRGSPATGWIPTSKGEAIEHCPDKLDWLDGLNLTYPIRYAHRDIILRSNPNLERASITKIDGPLFPTFQDIDLTESKAVELEHCKKPITLDVKTSTKGSSDASHIIFGISTTIQRLEDSVPQLLRWLPNTQAKLVVIVIEKEQVGEAEGVERVDAVAADSTQMEALESKMRGMGMNVDLVPPLGLQDMFSEKYFSLVKIMYGKLTDKTLWVSLLDDDTFFPSIPALLSMLAKYNAHEQYYIGGLSEDWWSVTHYGMMAFGGAGVFLSIALAEILVANYDICIESSYANAGDIRVMECIYMVTEIKLTNERGLHQIDVHGDLSGIYESGHMPLSLHHWKPGGADDLGYPLPQMSLVADLCEDCFLQRWQIGEDTILSNGYSISVYPKDILKNINFEQTEETWRPTPVVEGSNNRGVDHSLAPIRQKLAPEEKIQYKIIDSSIVEGGVRQSYLHTGLDGDLDNLFEIFWIAEQHDEGVRNDSDVSIRQQ